VDLIYLDPPFNSNRSYNVIFAKHARTDMPPPILPYVQAAKASLPAAQQMTFDSAEDAADGE
jgi:16S rRNA G966 N2-methylase RsmD